MMKKHLFFILFSSIVCEISSAHITVHGHRGARARFPENTMPAFVHALKAGVDVLEMDMAITKDKVIVISHDPHINGDICLDPQGKPVKNGPLIYSLTLAEVKKYDCGALRNPKFPKQQPIQGTQIPTLKEVFDMVLKSEFPSAKTVKFNIETKIEPEHPEYTVSPEEFVQLFITVVKKYKLQSRVIMQSFDYRTLQAVKKIAPEIKISALTQNPREDIVKTAKDLGAQYISPYFKMLSQEALENLHLAKVKVAPWTVNEPNDWKTMVQMGVDDIITDDPEALIQYLNQSNSR